MVREAGLVFVQSNIPGIMEAVFDPPVGTQHVQELERRSLFGRQAGHAINGVLAGFLGFRHGDGAFELEDLLQEGPIEEIIELAASGEGPYFQSAMTFAREGGRAKVLGWTTLAG